MHIPNIKDKCVLESGFKFSIKHALTDDDTFEIVCEQANIIKQLSSLRKILKDKQQIETLLAKVNKHMTID